MYRADLWNAARGLPARMLRQGRALSFIGGFFVALSQGQTVVQAQELPQVQTGVNARFDGALAPEVTGNNMVINQVADKATLHWQSFNIGQGHGVEFNQPDGSSVALNRIFDGVPSQISGQLKANGQVYLINSNGIVFGDGAQVNVQSLVASTLNIDDQVFNEIGIVNAINAAGGALPAFDSQGVPMGEIRIAPGANLESARTGRILIFAPTIVNEGTIRTPEGQQVLAASQDRVLIAASEDPDLRGLLIEVSTGGDVTNVGNLIAERGNITLLGLAVNQQGVARATTSVSLNGSIRLVAQDMNGTLTLGNDLLPRRPRATRGGDLVLADGSVTEVVPDTSLTEDGDPILALDAQAQRRSQVDLTATRVRLEAGSRVTSTGGDINIVAAADPGATPELRQPGDPSAVPSEIVVESGAVVDASGDKSTVVSVNRNVVEVEARGNELADSPLQRDGPIRNQTLKVDIRTGTDFLNFEGAAASIQRSAAERQSTGGSISIISEGRAVLSDGARVDVSGGQVAYSAGTVRTSRLQQSDGTVVDIATADPNRSYRGVASDAVRREAGYLEGKDAGSLSIQALGITLDATVDASAIRGVYQRQAAADLSAGISPTFARRFDEVPLGGALAIDLLRSGLPDLIIGATPTGPAAGVAPLVLATDWLQASGFTRLGLVNAGAIVVNRDLMLPAFSNMSLTGTQVNILADVRSPGGQLNLNTTTVGGLIPEQDQLIEIDGRIDLSGTWVNDNPLLNPTPPTAPIVLDGGRLNVDSGVSIEVSNESLLDVGAGAWLAANGSFTGGQGGRISLTTGETANPAFGARLDLGAELRGFGFSRGGELAINVERIRVIPGAASQPSDGFVLDGSREFSLETLDGAGISQYVLQVGAGIFEQGGFSSFELSTSRPDLAITPDIEIRLRTSSLALTDSQAGLRATGTAIGSLAAPILLPPISRAPARLVLTANNDLLNALGPVADLSLGAGARIIADALSEVTLRSDTNLFIEGRIEAPGGRINLDLGNGSGGFQPAQMIWFGAGSSLSANGAVLLDPVTLVGRRQGLVLDAGQIAVRADQGSIVAAAGSRLSADGAATTLDIGAGIPVPTLVASAAGTIELTAAESLLFQGTLSAAAPSGSTAPGGRLIVGLDPDRRGVGELVTVDGIPRGPHTLVMQDYSGALPGAGQAIDPALYSTGFVPISQLGPGGFDALEVIVRSSATSSNSVGVPVPDTLVSLPVIRFPVDLSLSLDRSIVLDAALFETAGAQVDLAAPYVALGFSDPRVKLDGAIPYRTSASNPQITSQPIRLDPTAGTGTLNVTGNLIELVGESATRGFGDAAAGTTGVTLTASEDLRVRGVRKVLTTDYAGLFRTAGNLLIDAPRLYPTTLTGFEIAVEGAGGELTLAGGGALGAPLSIGGALTLTADQINQGGSLYAPLGTLNLNAASRLSFSAGSLTSTSAAGVTAPFFRTEPGGALILPAPGAGGVQVVFVENVGNPLFERELPRQGINLSAPDVALLPGSRFDLRGGGDVRATEFVPGPGGSRDILLASLDGGANPSFAILPAHGGFAPFDPLETPGAADTQGLRIGDTLILEEGLPGLPAGEYAILPARYALFGGYLVTPVQGSADLPAGQSLIGLDGIPILAGRLGVAGNDTASSRSLGFAIESGEQVRQRAEYLETPLDTLYSSDTLRAPGDGGSLVIQAGDSLTLQGELLRATTTQGLGVAVDIATSAALSVVNQFSGVGGIELLAADLENLGADSLLLGGRRTRLAEAVRIDVASSGINVAAGVDLDLPELLLVADNIVIDGADDAATRLTSTATASNRATRILLEDDAAILAVSNRVLTLDRGAATGAGNSSLGLGSEATLVANGSLLLDAGGNVSLAGTLADTDGAISLGAGLVSLGDTEGQGITNGLVLSNAALAGFSGSDLRLRSAGSLDLYGALGGDPAEPLTFGRLTLDAQGLVGIANDGQQAILRADTIELRNGSGGSLAGPPSPAAAGSGLELRADRLELGNGRVDIAGFESTLLAGGDTLLVTGDTDLRVAGDLAIDTPLITAAQATTGNIAATGSLNVLAGDAAAALPTGAGLAAQLTLSAADVDFAGRIRLPSGTVRLIQTGDPANPVPGAGLRLADTAEIDVAGTTLGFGPKQLGTPGGAIELTAGTGDLQLASARLDVSSASTGGGAGSLSLRAPAGEVSFGPGASLLGQDPTGATGRFNLDAARLVATEPSLASPVSALAELLAAGEFAGRQAIRLRNQDIVVDSETTMVARDIRLSSDTGAVSIAGTLDASGANAGSIWLAAGDALTLSGTLRAASTTVGSAGGRVDLHALDADGDDSAGLADVINLTAGSLIDVTGGADGAGGTVLLHTRRLDTNSDDQTDTLLLGALDGDISGAGRAQLVATRILRDPGATLVADPGTGTLVPRVTITSSQIGAWRTETETFLNGQASLAGPLTLTAGLQVESTGDLILADAWNFYDSWYFGRDLSDATNPLPGLTGVTTLRAARNIELRADLTDSFAPQLIFGFFQLDQVTGAINRLDGSGNVVERIAPQSWNYRLAAGADLASADVLATGAGPGELRLDPGVRVRTGTGDIDLAASGDIRLRNGAAVYTAGWNQGTSAQLNELLGPTLAEGGITTDEFFALLLNGGQYPDGGGNVGITAGGRVFADSAPGATTAWQPRIGSGVIGERFYSADGLGAIPTHWGVAYDQFRNGIGVFGGGNLRVDAGGDVANLALAAPTTGRSREGVEADTTGGQVLFLPSQRSTEVFGGGRIDLNAVGRLVGGQVVLGRGTAALRTGTSTVGGGANPALYVGADAELRWTATGDLTVAGLDDPTVVALDQSQLTLLSQVFANATTTNDIQNGFYTYTPASRVTLNSVGGDVSLDGSGFGQFLPPSLAAVSFGGDVNVVASPLVFFPSPVGQLELLARDNVTGNFIGSTEARLTQSDQDRSLLPSVERPDIASFPAFPAASPVHAGDTVRNLIVARDGSVQSRPGNAGFWTLELAKATLVQAGTDISNVSVRVQNIAATDLTSFQAGRDIRFGDLRTNTGQFSADDRRRFEIWGPGAAEFLAGRDISLGTSAGIETIGNTRNAALSPDGASLLLLAGTGGDPAWDRFIEVYLSDGPSAYRDELNDFLARVEQGREGFDSSSEEPVDLAIQPGEYTERLLEFLEAAGIPVVGDDPVGTLQSLDRGVQRTLLADIAFSELKEWGSASETPSRADRLNYTRAFTALDTLFALEAPLGERAGDFGPGTVEDTIRGFLTITDPQAANDAQVALFATFFPPGEQKGDIDLLLSQVQTLAGGNLTMLAPGGDINAGAADSGIIAKQPADLGIVTARGGAINIAVDRDLLVNSTRVFALQGDLLVWSSNGNIDAGKGAKTVTSVPDPITRIDADGQTIIEFPPAVAGSGLQGENAALFAPRGAVNAGDAGIRTSGDLTIGAVEVVGTDNIDVGGVEIGFSTSDVAAVAPPGAAAASSAATKGVESQAGLLGDADESGARTLQGTQVSFITVEVLGFGPPCDPEEEDCD